LIFLAFPIQIIVELIATTGVGRTEEKSIEKCCKDWREKYYLPKIFQQEKIKYSQIL